MISYPDIELDCSPKHQHGRVSIAILDPVDLEVPHYRANGSEKAKQEDTDEADLLTAVDIELE